MKLIKRNIRLAVAAVCLLMASLVAYGAWSLSYFGNRWFSSGVNSYLRQIKRDVIPGRVYDRNGVLLAATDGQTRRVYHQDPIVRSVMVHLIGDRGNNVAYGVESFMAAWLYAAGEGYLPRLFSALSGQPRRGWDLQLSADSALCRLIAEQFPPGKSGAAVVMNWKTGELLALMSFPGFDPMLADPGREKDPLQPYWNRATRWISAPGSTFKVVTLASALQNIPSVMDRTFTCTGGLQIGQGENAVVITDAGLAAHGELDLKKALAVSCNVTFAQLALELGDEALRRTAQRFGLDDYLLFTDLVVENASYPRVNRVPKEIAWTGAGQSAVSITPLHMCLIAAGIANDGVMMEPRLLLRALDNRGNTRQSFVPVIYRTPMSKADADTVADAMRAAVLTGTAARAAVPGIRVSGKTGSAQVEGQAETNAWFIGFIDDMAMPYAVCVVVSDAGGGGEVAAPIARNVFDYLRLNSGR